MSNAWAKHGKAAPGSETTEAPKRPTLLRRDSLVKCLVTVGDKKIPIVRDRKLVKAMVKLERRK